MDRALQQLSSYDWLLFTSANTVRAVTERAAAIGFALKQPSNLRIAAVGEATAVAVRKAGFNVALVPESYVAESLLETLADQVSGKRVLLARAAIARDVIPETLRAAGALVDVVDAYRNMLPADAPGRLRQALERPVDAVTFTSSSSATHLAEAALKAGIEFPFQGVAAVSIGPITSATLRELGWEPASEADPSDVPGLIQAVVKVSQAE